MVDTHLNETVEGAGVVLQSCSMGVVVTALPGLLGAGGDGTDAKGEEGLSFCVEKNIFYIYICGIVSGDDCPGVEGEAALAEKVNAIMEELVQDGKI